VGGHPTRSGVNIQKMSRISEKKTASPSSQLKTAEWQCLYSALQSRPQRTVAAVGNLQLQDGIRVSGDKVRLTQGLDTLKLPA